jgi:hypothetical protein
VRQVKLPFADPRRSYTQAFERYALDLSRHMTIKGIQAALPERRFGAPKLGKLKHCNAKPPDREFYKLKILGIHETQYV